MMCIAANATVTEWKTDAANSNWSSGANWTNGAPAAGIDVVIPANCSVYPELKEADHAKCRNIYFEVKLMDGASTTNSARIGNQHLLTYEKTFCDVTIRAHRWVRITAPLKNIYSGDYFVKHQTMNQRAWGGSEYDKQAHKIPGTTLSDPNEYKFEEATYKANSKSDNPDNYMNRSKKGTYQSFYSTQRIVHDAYDGIDLVNTFASQWGEPSNPLGTPIQPAMGFDVWVNYGDNPSYRDKEVTFRFPTTNDEYYYYQSNGEINTLRQPDQIDRSKNHGKMAFDKDDVKNDTADYTVTREGTGSHSKMFAVGNPGFAYLDIAKFLDVNVSKGHTYRYVYAHKEEFDGRGTEDIYFYNYPVEKKLYKLTSEANPGADASNPNDSTAEKNVVQNTSREAYLNPAEGFRVFGGGVSYKCDEPDLIGVYRSAVATIPSDLWQKYYTADGKLVEGDNAYSNLEIPMLKAHQVMFDYSITVVPGHPEQVRINNFLNLGSVVATINRANQTLTIAKGTPMMSVFGGSGASTGKPGDDFWSFIPSTGDGTSTLTRNGEAAKYRTFEIYGTNDANWEFSNAQYTLYEGTEGAGTQGGKDDAFIKANNIKNSTAEGSNVCDIKLKYTIASDGAVNISLDETVGKIFLRSDAVGGACESNAPAYHHDEDYMDACLCEAWMAYESVSSKKAADVLSSFIMKDLNMEGTYQVKVKSVSGNTEVTANDVYQGIQIARISGRNDVVSVSGLFPGDNTPALGQIELKPVMVRKTDTRTFNASDFSSRTTQKKGEVTVVMPNQSSNFELFWTVVNTTKKSINIYSSNVKYRITSITLNGFSGKILNTYYAGRWSTDIGSVSSAWRNYQTWVGDANNITLTNTRNTHILGDDGYFGGVKIQSIEVTYEWYEPGDEAYHLCIPAGQLVRITDANGTPAPQNDYYFYTHGNAYARTNLIEMIWRPASVNNQQGYWETTSYSKNKNNHNTMVSRQGWQPDAPASVGVGGQLGWVLGEERPAGSVETCYFNRINDSFTEDTDYDASEDFSENPASTSSFIDLTFTPDMFVANIQTSAPAPKRAPAAAVKAPVIISATADNMQASTMIIQDFKANDGYSAYEDAAIFDVESYAFSFGTLAGSHLVGVNSIASEELIPLFISKSATLRFSNIATLGEAYLYDAVADTRVLINDTCAYTLEILEGQQAGRYFIETNIEAPAIETDIEDVQAEGFSWKPVAYCPASGSLSVACADESVRFELYNLSGQKLGESRGSNTFQGLSKGTYIVNAIRGGEQQGLKVIVY